jgi:hypothetical protein
MAESENLGRKFEKIADDLRTASSDDPRWKKAWNIALPVQQENELDLYGHADPGGTYGNPDPAASRKRS